MAKGTLSIAGADTLTAADLAPDSGRDLGPDLGPNVGQTNS